MVQHQRSSIYDISTKRNPESHEDLPPSQLFGIFALASTLREFSFFQTVIKAGPPPHISSLLFLFLSRFSMNFFLCIRPSCKYGTVDPWSRTRNLTSDVIHSILPSREAANSTPFTGNALSSTALEALSVKVTSAW
jgi:hypothetical protein